MQPTSDFVDAAEDLRILRNYWHPVAYSRDVAGAPVAAVVLGEPVVLFRGAGDRVAACRDLCPHRGAKISMGKVVDGAIVCPYHAFRYDTSGRCTHIPQQPADRQTIPSRLRLETYLAEERYGIVWVALDEPRLPIPACPDFDDPDLYSYAPEPVTWSTSAARWIENFMDMTHLAHVHPGILGDPDDAVVDPYEVELLPDGIGFEFPFLQQLDPSKWPKEEGGELHLEDAVARHRVHLPFTILSANTTETGYWSLWAAGLPVGPATVKIFTIQSRDYMLDEPDDLFTEMFFAIAGQDQPIIEHQHPERLPVDLTEEVHLRAGDACGIAYRRQLRELGLRYA